MWSEHQSGLQGGVLHAVHCLERFCPVNGAMKIFLDTADLKEIREYAATGLVDGVTTNPSLAAKTGRDYAESLKEICGIVKGSVSAEVIATDLDGMLKEGRVAMKIAPNIYVKVPSTWD